jgi:ferric-dicitrate binding protein FerR (iron transport regulator)
MEYQTTAGQHVKIVLPDQSVVILNGNSYLKYPEAFTQDNRLVHFRGQGYFKIQKDSTRLFQVDLQDYQINVYGTEFNVVNDPGSDKVEIALVSGTIDVALLDENHIPLIPGQQLLIDRLNRDTWLKNFKPVEVVGWKDRYFLFENQLLSEVLTVLDRNYPHKFVYNPEKFGTCRLSAEFNNQSIWTILEALKFAAGIEYTVQNDNQIVLTGKCN